MPNGTTTIGTQPTTTQPISPLQKSNINFPFVQPNQPLPLTQAAIQQPIQPQPVQPTGALAGAGQVFDPSLSQQVVQTAQQRAITGAPPETLQQVSGRTQEFLADPTLGRDPEATKRATLDQLSRQQAQGFEAFRQATGGEAATGVNVQDLLATQLQQRQERTDVERQLDIDEQNRRQQELIAALGEGRATAGLEQAVQTGDIQNLIDAAGGALGFAELASQRDILLSEQDFSATQNQLNQQFELAVQSNDINAQKTILGQKLAFEAKQAELGREFTESQSTLNRTLQENLAILDADTQREIVTLKGQIDQDLLLSEQDFAGSEAEIDRQLQLALQAGDFAQAQQLQAIQNDFESLKQQQDQAWQTAENIAQNAFTEQMVMTEQDFNRATQVLQFDQEQALNLQDNELQQILLDKQSELELQMMTQSFGHEEKLAILNSELQDAIANNDVTRQKDLYSFSHGLEQQRIEQEQGFNESLAYLDQSFNLAIQENDFEQARVLTQMTFDQQMEMHLDNVALDEARIALEERGIDLAQIDSEYAKIQEQILLGKANPDDAIAFLEAAYADSLPEGFKLTKPAPNATQKAIEENFKNEMFQYAIRQGDADNDGLLDAATYDEEGNFTGLQDIYEKSYMDHLNKTIYQQEGTPIQSAVVKLKDGTVSFNTITGVDDPIYQYLLTDSSVTSVRDTGGSALIAPKTEIGRGKSRRAAWPALENNKFINMDGTIWAVTGKSVDTRGGPDWTQYTIVNVLTGESVVKIAKD